MEQAITRLGEDGFVGVYAANDGTAGGAIAAMKAAGINPLPPITGQDAELAAIQRILAGEQYMTVYKAIKPEAEIAAEVAVALARGEDPPDDQVNQQVDNGESDVPSMILDPVAVTKENVNDTVVADGFWTADEICEGDYAAACEDAGIALVTDRRAAGRRADPVDEPADTAARSCSGISKRFGAVQALTEVDFECDAGEVVALVGDNGAGKSTLVKVIAGTQPGRRGHASPSTASAVHIGSPQAATALGIATVYQDLALCDNLDVVANLFLGRERARGVGSNLRCSTRSAMEHEARGPARSGCRCGIPSVRTQVASLSGGQRQSIAVARATMGEPKLVMLDEPTAALGVAQTRQVLDLVRRAARREGLGVVVISHNLVDVFAVADRIVVLRLGRRVATFDAPTPRPRRWWPPSPAPSTDRGPLGLHDGGVHEPSREIDPRPRRRPSPGGLAGALQRLLARASPRASWAACPSSLGLVAVWIYFQIANSNFLSSGNLTNLMLQIAAMGTISVGIVLVLLLGEIDLSVGSVSGLAAATMAVLNVKSGWPAVPAILAGLAVGAAIGLLQGLWVTKLRVPSFVVTLAGLLAWQGALLHVLGEHGHGQPHRRHDHRPDRHVLLRRRRAGRWRRRHRA